jgi:gamma-glutamyltranspeptidase/glutathione hydrolase
MLPNGSKPSSPVQRVNCHLSPRTLARRLACLAAAFALVFLGQAAVAADAAPVRATQQMVVSANAHATEAGIRILREGGGAVDAAIAVQLVLSLVEPQSSGVGGGAFMLYFDAPDEPGKHGEVTSYEGRETAPAAATADMFLEPDGEPASFLAVGTGGLAVGVPGVMRMLEMAHREHGRLPWRELFAPALELAQQGFELSPRLYFLLDQARGYARVPEFLATYYGASGEPLPAGHRLVSPEYAQTLRALAGDGAEVMYSGSLASAIVAAVRDNPVRGGRLTLDDMKRYQAHEASPLCTTYREWRVCGPQLPSSGGITVQQTLGILRPFDLRASGDETPESIHLIAEASRLAFADRNLYLGDPAFIDVPVAALLATDYLAQRSALVDPRRALSSVSAGMPLPQAATNLAPSLPRERPSTSHLSIVDKWGDAVSMTTSVQGAFGSQLMVGGFILNNQLTDFSFLPRRQGQPVANRVQPGKRPLSSMAPTLVLDAQDRLRMVIGTPGGTRIINFVTQALVGVIDWQKDIQAAVAAPHFVAQTDSVEIEEGTALGEERSALEAMGHRVVERNLNSGLHGITIDYTDTGQILWGGVDPRREGLAVGD